MPNRIIKESICTSDTIDLLTAEEERFFYRLIVQADDFGRFDGRAPVVLAGTFPLRSHEIHIDLVEAWLQRLAEVDLIRFYHVGGRRYLYFTTWDKHQQRRAKYSKFPEPPSDVVAMKSSDITRNQVPADAPEESRNREYEESRQTDETRAPGREPVLDPDPLPDAFVGRSVGPDGQFPDPHDDMTIRDAAHRYQQRIGIMGPSLMPAWDRWHSEHGVSFGVVALAIDEASEARPRAPDKYIDGIIRNKVNQGIRTVEDWWGKERADPRRPETEEEAAAYLDRVLGVIDDDAGTSAGGVGAAS